jgi:hypothetical protein
MIRSTFKTDSMSALLDLAPSGPAIKGLKRFLKKYFFQIYQD